MPEPCIVTIGEALAVLSAPRGTRLEDAETLSASVAGAEFNVAVAVRRLGFASAFLGAVGQDAWGRKIRHVARAEGVDVTGLEEDPGCPTGLVFKTFWGNRAEVTYRRAGSAASAYDPEPETVTRRAQGALAIHTTGISFAVSPSLRRASSRLLANAPPEALRSFDLNVRHRLGDAQAWRLIWQEGTLLANLVFAGDGELSAVGIDPEEAARAIVGRGGTLVERRGPGAPTRVHTPDGTLLMDPPAMLAEIVDEVGAGDAFDATVLVERLRGHGWKEAIRAAHLAGTQVAGTRGDYEGAPYQEELEALKGKGLVQR